MINRKISLTEELKDHALSAGIDVIGITSAKPFRVKGDKEKHINPQEVLSKRQNNRILK